MWLCYVCVRTDDDVSIIMKIFNDIIHWCNTWGKSDVFNIRPVHENNYNIDLKIRNKFDGK